MNVGKQIKYYRKLQGYTQKNLAEKCGLAVGTIQQYELGKREPKMEMLIKIVNALGISIDILLGYPQSDISTLPLNDMNKDEINPEMYKIIDDEIPLLKSYRNLNKTGRMKALERVEELTEIKKYTDL